MARKSVKLTSLGTDNTHTISGRIREQAMRHVSRFIHAWLIENRMKPAELARKAGLPRDSISRYLLKKSLPTEESLRPLAKAMGCDVNDLLPNRPEVLVDPDNATMEIVSLPDKPGKARLRVDQIVSFDVAMKIVQMLQADNDDKSDGKRSR